MKRLDVLPDVRSFDEAGIRNYAYGTWGGLGLRAGTPKPIVDRFFAAVQTAVRDPQFQACLANRSDRYRTQRVACGLLK